MGHYLGVPKKSPCRHHSWRNMVLHKWPTAGGRPGSGIKQTCVWLPLQQETCEDAITSLETACSSVSRADTKHQDAVVKQCHHVWASQASELEDASSSSTLCSHSLLPGFLGAQEGRLSPLGYSLLPNVLIHKTITICRTSYKITAEAVTAATDS